MASRPLLEARTPDEALTLAREQFGEDAAVGVRMTRSGGLLGFFATEKYVAEVAEAPVPTTGSESGALASVSPIAARRGQDDLSAVIEDFSDLLGGGTSQPETQEWRAPTLTRLPAAPTPAPAVVPAATGPRPAPSASAFASALSRMIGEPEVTAAVLTAVDNADATEHTPPVAASGSAPIGGSGGGYGGYNLAAALVANRGTNPTVATAAAPGTAEIAEEPQDQLDVASSATQVAVMATLLPHAEDPTGLLPRLAMTGFPTGLVPDLFLHEVAEKGPHAALTRLLRMRTAPAPALPVAPCTIVLVGPGVEALTAAQQAASSLRANPAQIAWAAPAHLSALVPSSRRLSGPEDAVEWLAKPARTGKVNVIAVHTPLSETHDPQTEALLAAIKPTMVLAVADATRKAEDVTRWIESLPRVDGIALENATETSSPATYLTLAAAGVALLDGRRATAPRWASLLCERLTEMEA